MPNEQSAPRFATQRLPAAATTVAPDGSDVRVLLELPSGGLAHFALSPRQTSTAVQHRTVSEIWYFISGAGQMWRAADGQEETVDVGPGVAITIPVGTKFQFRSTSDEPLVAVGFTTPPWPGDTEALAVDGPWTPNDRPRSR